MTEATRPKPILLGRKRRLALKVLAWVGLGLIVVLSLFYVRLLFGPISLNFLSDRAKSMVAGIVEDDFSIDWSDFGLSLTGPVSVGFHLAGVTLTERSSDAVIRMEALEIAVSPIGAAMGRPDARVIMIRPQIQMLQNLLGPRISRFEFIEEEGTGETVVRVMEGEATAPSVRIGDEGISLGATRGADEIGLRSDNDWLKLNLEALDEALAGLADQAMDGQILRFEIRDGTVGVLDTVYGLYKSLDEVDLEVRSGRQDGRVSALFSAHIAGETMDGSLVRQVDEGQTRIDGEVHNIDFSTIVPFLDDATGLAALRGTGGLTLGVMFDGESGVVQSGRFAIDLNGTRLRLDKDMFPISAEPINVNWTPERALFSLEETAISVGSSRALLGGDIVMGFDEQFGPTLGMSIRARDVWLHPDDLGVPKEPFDEFSFEGWSAPLYGAVGIDRLVGAKDGTSIVVQGRIDMVREGVGLDVVMSGRGASADDVKRLWPYLFAPEGRDWFTEFVRDGHIQTADMRFNFPVGSMENNGEGGPVPEGAMSIDLVGRDVELNAFDGMPEFEVEGETRLTMRDNQLTVAMERARLPGHGDISVANAAYINQNTAAEAQIFEVSGDVQGSAAAMMAMATSDEVNILQGVEMGVDVQQLGRTVDGQVDATVIATINLDEAGEMIDADYTLNGSIVDLASSEPIAGYSFSDASIDFTASQDSFRILGSGMVGDMEVDVQAIKTNGGAPDILVGSTFEVAAAAELGIDLSEFMSGRVRVVGKPLTDGRFEVSADLTDTALTISDIGITKARGTAGTLTAVVGIGANEISISDVDLGFGTVQLAGDITLSPAGELQSADFSTFRISAGDSARVLMTPFEGGYAFTIDGEQLDLKPVLKRFFNLDGDASVGASEDLRDQIFTVDVNLDRALGYYGEAAFNLDLDLQVRGEQLRRVNLTTQFLGNRSASATTNPLASGRVISYATNDLGAMLRFVGVYPRLVGGEGSMVLRYDNAAQADAGAFEVRNFAIVDEDNLDAIIGEHDQSRAALAGVSAMEFEHGRAQFIRYSDRVEVLDAAIYGDMVGGTIRGNVLTDSGRYDLAGTYVPLFGLNNFFQQIPVLGPIFGGREGEGLLGVTFAVRGALDQPELLINPVSILAPGVFRTLFEYRAGDQAAAR